MVKKQGQRINLKPIAVIVLSVLLSAMFFLYDQASASVTLGTIDGTYKYAWGENVGWINFGCDECDVTINDNGISGYAWSSQYGWINLSPNASGVMNDEEGNLSGYAWGQNLGWVNFSGVTINAEGEFSGYATVDSNGSRVSFSCTNGNSCAQADFKVKTDWIPSHARPGSTSSGGKPKPQQPPPVAQPPALPPPTPLAATVPSPGLAANIYNAVDSITEFLARLFRREDPRVIVEVPEVASPIFRAIWNLLPEPEINSFVFAPLPYQLRIIAGKFPELQKTFQEVGVERFTDVHKLAGITFSVPDLADVLNTAIKNMSPGELAELAKIKGVTLHLPGVSGVPGIARGNIGTGKIELISGLPVANFSLAAKKNLPGEFVFARTGGELVDLSVALSVSENGEVTQRISALPGKTLRLVVKPISRAKSVTGYIVFRAPTPKVAEHQIVRSSLAASALFSMSGLVEKISSPVPVEQKLVLSSFEYTDSDEDGIYTADVVTPVVPGEYEVITVIDYVDPVLGSRKISMITVIDPEGYVFEKNNGKETRIPSAIVSLYALNFATKKYGLWDAYRYQQENPQITDVRGTYSFLVPEGSYYFYVEAPGYRTYQGKAFGVTAGNGIHQNIELKSANIWPAGLDWQTVLLIVVLLLVYNLYRNNLRNRLSELLNKNGKQ